MPAKGSSDKINNAKPKKRVTRQRRRLYEPLAEESPKGAVEEKPADAKSKTSSGTATAKKVGGRNRGEKAKKEEASEVVDIMTDDKEVAAMGKVRKYMYWSMGVGIIPVPLIDIASTTAMQLMMLRDISAIYDIPFSSNRGKSIIASLLGGMGSYSLARGIGGSVLKLIPFVGHVVGFVSFAIMSGATTYAVGKVFIQHFESGGTFLDLDPEEVKAYFAEQFAKGKKVAEELKNKGS